MQILGTFGRGIGLNPDDVKMEDSTKPVKVEDVYIYGGSPLAMFSDSGTFKLASWGHLNAASLTLNVKPYGIAKFNKNAYIDETFDSLGTYGSGKGTVIQLGRVSLLNNVFRTSDSGVQTVFAFDTAQTYTPMQALYVNCDNQSAAFGKITNQLVSTETADRNDNTLVGYVANWFPHATQPVLELLVK
jgi:hypothetical protein